ncbi:uncharacterized protein LOC119335562 [Triticum dicoccoides]|uniref:F-box domain-containing protein n=1 Tax=Triticum turgidum subsp. durum TaxID=4567 RepID=A0A9R1A9Q9_TRITD|nr:uncharacterized protein LOC119335562 [Triticum dicoccoides]VAI90715.1 unnamed protein product [Triticum turgidum subsp. durum]
MRGEMSPRRCRRRTAPPSPPPASLPDADDLLRKILLRLPPRPSSLPRASLVCKRWRSIVSDPQFQRLFRAHHGKPPLLGFFLDGSLSSPFFPMLDRPDRIPSARFSMLLYERNRIIDCRHGLVLFLCPGPPRRLLVWDPVSREQRHLISPPELDSDQLFIFNGAVLRPAGGQGCSSSHFQVALVARDGACTRVSICVYSSETGIWSNVKSLQMKLSIPIERASTSIGNSLCWLLPVHDQNVILEFDLVKQTLAVTELPVPVEPDYQNLWIIPAEDGGLGFIHLSQFHAELWKRMPDSDGLDAWVLDRAIEFEELKPTCKGYSPALVGFAEESNAILVQTDSGVFMVYLQSTEFKKVSDLSVFCIHYPFACFYPAGTGIGDVHGGDEVLNNM